MKKNPV